MNLYEKYDQLETEFGNQFGYFILESFKSAWFAKTGRMTGVNLDSELWRSLNSHHEGRMVKILQESLMSQLTDGEVRIVTSAFETALKFCKVYKIHSSMIGLSVFASALFQYRAARLFASPGDLILEIGPGSGFLSLMLAQSGSHVHSIECTKMHYAFQNRLFNEATIHYIDGMDIERIEMPAVSQGSIVHLPWWKIVRPELWKNVAGKFKMVTCNHAFLEMGGFAREFYVRLAELLLKPDGVLMMDSPGAQADPAFGLGQLVGLFKSCGLSQVWKVNANNGAKIGTDVIFAGRAIINPVVHDLTHSAANVKKFLELSNRIEPRPIQSKFYSNEDWLKDWNISH